MCLADDPITTAYQAYQDELVAAGLLLPSGVPGVYGLSGVFGTVIEQFERYATRLGAHLRPEVVRFPPCRLSWTTRKSSKAAWVNCGLPAQSPIAHTRGAVVARRSSTAT